MSKKKDYSTTRVDFFISGSAPHACGYIPNDKVYEYIEKITTKGR